MQLTIKAYKNEKESKKFEPLTEKEKLRYAEIFKVEGGKEERLRREWGDAALDI